MRTPNLKLHASPARVAVAAALAAGLIAGCSSSVSPESEEPTPTETVTQESQDTTDTTAEESDAPSDSSQTPAEQDPFEGKPMEGSPVDWTEMTIDGEDHFALVPAEAHGGGGSVVWKDTTDLTNVKFTAALPANTNIQSPIIVKAITAQNGRPQMVTLEPGGEPQTLDVPMSNSDIFKIVWNVEGRPAEGPNVMFYDFVVSK